jgi:hypothetical protein
MSMDSVVLYVVYENPRDFPDKFVVRRWQNSRAAAAAHRL